MDWSDLPREVTSHIGEILQSDLNEPFIFKFRYDVKRSGRKKGLFQTAIVWSYRCFVSFTEELVNNNRAIG